MTNPELVWVGDHQLAWVRTPAPNPRPPHRIKVRFLLSEYRGASLKAAIAMFSGRLESSSHGVLWASFEVPPHRRPSEFRAYIHENVDHFAYNP